jgi:Trk K+ transport system NAD-binding subunit
MRVTIVGAGDVGTGIAERLAGSHDVTVVDVEENRPDVLAATGDVRTVHGDGRSLATLEEAGVAEAVILAASTDRDGANVMICGAAKNTTDVRTIARVKRVALYETWQDAEGAFGIDDMLCVNRLTARAIVRTTTLPGASAVETVRLLADRGYRTRVIERDRERASEIAAALPETEIVEGEATSVSFLSGEEIGDAEVLISTLGDNETNYLMSLLAKRLGVAHAVSIVDAAEHVSLFEAAGIEVAARPRDIVAGEIAGLVLGTGVDSVTLFENDRAEVLEVTTNSDSVLAGELLRDVADDLPDGFVIGALVRGGTLRPPRGGTVMQTGDHVIAFLDSGIIEDVAPEL